MEYEFKKVKEYKKKYNSVDGKEKIVSTKTIYLGKETIFTADEEVAIISAKGFDKLKENQEVSNSDEIISDLKNDLKIKDDLILENSSKILEMEMEIKSLKKKSDELDTAKNVIIALQQNEKYNEKIILMYETYNLRKRLFKSNPKDEIDIPEKILIDGNSKKPDSEKK